MSEKPRILIIDDDEDVRKVVMTALQDEGYLVEPASNGAEAVKKTESQVYNLAVIDIRLPDLEGTQLLSKMKDTTPKMRKIILTGYADLRNAIEAVNKGADGYLTKPVEMNQLVEMIKTQLLKQREERNYGEGKIKQFIETRLKELDGRD